MDLTITSFVCSGNYKGIMIFSYFSGHKTSRWEPPFQISENPRELVGKPCSAAFTRQRSIPSPAPPGGLALVSDGVGGGSPNTFAHSTVLRNSAPFPRWLNSVSRAPV